LGIKVFERERVPWKEEDGKEERRHRGKERGFKKKKLESNISFFFE